MERYFTLEYWMDDGWYVGKLREVPGVFSQGETLEELEQNIQDAYRVTLDEELAFEHPGSKTKDVMVQIS
ncbi:MAG: type II toxin-antitoxin system HicB family antitoxin [Acidobacteria bacterium]|nr:type II toxin-antitoxin system HicB family antitoxin [Acidobacteriota bacterium]MCI0625438.1 type II toxin-antitoxin system HicB family antitoxin [Acidobacteriota bacterium]MCI0717526.1 type II toxin-antitoxin system HicB family antitoxin [Acidobacteriota bacterium]